MPYFLLRTPQGSVEVFAQTLQQAIELAGGNDPGMQGQVSLDSSIPLAGTPQPVGAPTTPAIGFSRTSVVDTRADARGRPPDTSNVPGGLENAFGGTGASGAFANALQFQGQNTEGLFGSYLRSLENPAAAVFNFRNASGQLGPGSPETAYQDFVKRTPFNQIRGLATNAFRDLTSPSVAPNADYRTLMNQYQDPYGQQPGGTYNATAVDRVTGLAGQAAATKYSPFTANELLPSGETAQRRFLQAGASSPYIDFLRKQYGLTGGF